MTDNNAAEIKSLSYVWKDRHIKSSKHYIKRREERDNPYTKFQHKTWHVIKQSRKYTEDNMLKSSKSLVESPSCRRRKIVRWLFPTPTPIRLDRILPFMFSVCVLRYIRGYGNGEEKHKIWSRHQSSGNWRCDWSPMSTWFIILIKICIKIGSWTRDGFWDLIMRGEGVRHPTTSVLRRFPPSMCSCVCLIKQNVGLLLGTNVLTLSGVHQLVMHTFDVVSFFILCSLFEYLVSLGFLVKQW